MTEPEVTSTEMEGSKTPLGHSIRSLRDLLDQIGGKALAPLTPEEGRVTEAQPFPYLAIVGQQEMKLALLLGLINPNIGGILLIGPRGTADRKSKRLNSSH